MKYLYARPGLVLLALALLLVGIGHRALFIEQDNSPDTLFAADREARATYRRMLQTFGGDEFVLVQLRGAKPSRLKDLRAVTRLAERLRRAPAVVQVIAPPAVTRADQVAQARAEIEAVAMYRRLGIYQPRAQALGVVAQIVTKGNAPRHALAAALDRISKDFEGEGYRPLAAGLSLANAAMDKESTRSLNIFMPLVMVLAALIGWLVFRSPKALVAMFLPVLGAQAMGVAGLEIAGQSLNLITAMMPPLVMAVGFAGAIHLVSHYGHLSEQQGLPPREAALQTIRDKFVPTAFAFATTALGFGSLALSDVPAVRVLGVATAGTLMAALVLVTLGTPALILTLKPKLRMPKRRSQLLAGVAIFALRHRFTVIAVGGAVALFAVVGVTYTRVNIDGMDMLPRDSKPRIAYQTLEREGLGLGNIDIWLHTRAPDRAALLADARRLQRMAAELEQAPRITGSVGVHDLLSIIGFRMGGKAALPESLAPLDLLPKRAQARVDRGLRQFWHPRKGLKLTLLASTGSMSTHAEQRRRILAAAARHFPGAKVDITGHYVMLVNTPTSLLKTLTRSLSLTVGVIAFLFFVAFRSPRLVLGGMFANLLPVVAVVGVMGWLDVPIDVATVMIGSIAFGIAVDDTFHYLYHRKKSGSIVRAAQTAGQGIVATSLVIAAGFSVLGLSGFDPIVRLGLFVALASLFALATNALLLPAIVGRRAEVEEHAAPTRRLRAEEAQSVAPARLE